VSIFLLISLLPPPPARGERGRVPRPNHFPLEFNLNNVILHHFFFLQVSPRREKKFYPGGRKKRPHHAFSLVSFPLSDRPPGLGGKEGPAQGTTRLGVNGCSTPPFLGGKRGRGGPPRSPLPSLRFQRGGGRKGGANHHLSSFVPPAARRGRKRRGSPGCFTCHPPAWVTGEREGGATLEKEGKALIESVLTPFHPTRRRLQSRNKAPLNLKLFSSFFKKRGKKPVGRKEITFHTFLSPETKKPTEGEKKKREPGPKRPLPPL